MRQTDEWLSVIVLGFLLSEGLSLDPSEYCTNPAGKHGRCRPLRECPPLVKLLRQIPIHAEKLSFLNQSRCSTPDGNEPSRSVCCPIDKLPKKPACGFGESDRLTGGQRAFVSEFPWAAMIEYRQQANDQIRRHCGATLISSRYVLTAAHCVQQPSSDGWEAVGVRLGEHNLETSPDCDDIEFCADPPVIVGIEKIVVHAGYNPLSKEHYDDIALIRLDKEIEFGDDIRPICLPVEESDRTRNITDTRWGQSVGWGLSKTGIESPSKLKVGLKILGRMTCSKSDEMKLRDTQFCTETEYDRQTCTVDSGGSFILRDRANLGLIILYGIASYGASSLCGTKAEPAVFTDVTKYIEWIESNIEI